MRWIWREKAYRNSGWLSGSEEELLHRRETFL